MPFSFDFLHVTHVDDKQHVSGESAGCHIHIYQPFVGRQQVGYGKQPDHTEYHGSQNGDYRRFHDPSHATQDGALYLVSRRQSLQGADFF